VQHFAREERARASAQVRAWQSLYVLLKPVEVNGAHGGTDTS